MVFYVDIHINKEHKVVTMNPIGNLDLSVSPKLEEILNKEIKTHPEYHIILDFEKVDYISSTCMRTIITADRQLKKNKKEMAIVNANTFVKDVFSVTHLDKIVRFFNNAEEALQALPK